MSIYPRTIFEVPRIALPAFVVVPRTIGSSAVDIVAEPIEVVISQRGNITHYPQAAVNSALDQEFEVSELDMAITILGSWLNVGIVAAPITVTLSNLGSLQVAVFFSSSALITLTINMGSPEIVTEGVKRGWVKWSNIGSLDFTVGKDNIAGERPLDWKGWVYAIKKLGNKIIVYGENGVSMLAPNENVFGLVPIYGVGLKGKHAVAGDEKIQFFIDNYGRLFSIGEIAMKSSLFESSITPERLDYSEFFNTMINPILSWDKLNNLLYICDGISGYVYSSEDKSLGEGPINITGIDTQDNTLYVVASSTIDNPVFEICTDIYDMGSRKNKTISTIELGTDATDDLFVSIDYRKDKAAEFKTLGWHKVNPNGIANIPCFGVEFRIRVKKTNYEYFELDYIRVNGIVHNYIFQYPYVGR